MTSYVVPDMLATSDDLAEWTKQAAPANADLVLRDCTTLVLDATRTACYETDPATGLAIDPNIAQALNDATCIQAAAWGKLGIDPLAGGIDTGGVKASKSIGSASFAIAGAAQTAAAKAFATDNLVPAAVRRLRQQNLITTFTRHT
ncbi:hypothetical protein [Humibacter ginsenosidimutans]|uniref:Uncharacterized protein n=1 Tax=Humibacter ginsenosidimutans TaxID=2599293 RepID=A0A5B8M620_9MICO|nr:hypothetical protein [Humibacter ginsenosidimutans]QDZ15783.1 hypothetical protein FPZ11_14335 [Humibacter ginsenosidimutans]